MINYLTQDPGEDKKIAVFGCTASAGHQNDLVKLGAARSAAVKQLLVSNGIQDDQIITRGLGFENPFYVYDKNPDGSLNESVASTNRKVIIMSADSKLACSLLSKDE